jgi:hypothetical protein
VVEKLSRSDRAWATALIFALFALARVSNWATFGSREAAARSSTSFTVSIPEPAPSADAIDPIMSACPL